MKIRGQRECQDCGARWSYYETGSVECPDCGSMRSVGTDDERRQHTANPVAFDLTEVRETVDELPLREVADRAKSTVREYVRKRGFVKAGELQPLDETYLAAHELLHVADVFRRSFAPGDDEELYFLSLLRGADDGERPDPADVPTSFRAPRGLAAADAVREYRSDLRTYLKENPDPTAERLVERLGDHVKRLRMLEGDVRPATAELLIAATRDIGRSLVEGDESALADAEDRLDRLAERTD